MDRCNRVSRQETSGHFQSKPKSRRLPLGGVAGPAKHPGRHSCPPAAASSVLGRQMPLVVLYVPTLQDACYRTQDRRIGGCANRRLRNCGKVSLNHLRYGDALLLGIALRAQDNRVIHAQCELRHLYVLYAPATSSLSPREETARVQPSPNP